MGDGLLYVSIKKIPEDANVGYYAILAINYFNLETARSALSAAEDTKTSIPWTCWRC